MSYILCTIWYILGVLSAWLLVQIAYRLNIIEYKGIPNEITKTKKD